MDDSRKHQVFSVRLLFVKNYSNSGFLKSDKISVSSVLLQILKKIIYENDSIWPLRREDTLLKMLNCFNLKLGRWFERSKEGHLCPLWRTSDEQRWRLIKQTMSHLQRVWALFPGDRDKYWESPSAVSQTSRDKEESSYFLFKHSRSSLFPDREANKSP